MPRGYLNTSLVHKTSRRNQQAEQPQRNSPNKLSRPPRSIFTVPHKYFPSIFRNRCIRFKISLHIRNFEREQIAPTTFHRHIDHFSRAIPRVHVPNNRTINTNILESTTDRKNSPAESFATDEVVTLVGAVHAKVIPCRSHPLMDIESSSYRCCCRE